MKKIVFVFFLISVSSFSQSMTFEKLGTIINQEADSVKQNTNSWNFAYKGKLIICIADVKANRMRIISLITEVNKLNEEQIVNALIANFHTALDVKYAISDKVLWSVFTHPLKELTSHQVKDAISQVYYANVTFGTLYSSTSLLFPSGKKQPEKKKLKQTLQKKI